MRRLGGDESRYWCNTVEGERAGYTSGLIRESEATHALRPDPREERHAIVVEPRGQPTYNMRLGTTRRVQAFIRLISPARASGLALSVVSHAFSGRNSTSIPASTSAAIRSE